MFLAGYEKILHFFKDLIYLFIDTEREAGSMLGARRGTRSQVSRITLRAAGGAKSLRHQGGPKTALLPQEE